MAEPLKELRERARGFIAARLRKRPIQTESTSAPVWTEDDAIAFASLIQSEAFLRDGSRDLAELASEITYTLRPTDAPGSSEYNVTWVRSKLLSIRSEARAQGMRDAAEIAELEAKEFDRSFMLLLRGGIPAMTEKIRGYFRALAGNIASRIRERAAEAQKEAIPAAYRCCPELNAAEAAEEFRKDRAVMPTAPEHTQSGTATGATSVEASAGVARDNVPISNPGDHHPEEWPLKSLRPEPSAGGAQPVCPACAKPVFTSQPDWRATAEGKLRRIDELVPYPNECPQWGIPDWRYMAKLINAILNEPTGKHAERGQEGKRGRG